MSKEAKFCSCCKETKPITDFYRQQINQCKQCRNAVISKWRAANREKLLEQARAANVIWYENNKAYAAQKQAAYAKQNKASVNARAAKRRAMQLKLTPAWAKLDEVAMFYEMAEVLSRSGVLFHVDHIIPLQGKNVWGLHTQENLQIIPAFKNVKKGNRYEAH